MKPAGSVWIRNGRIDDDTLVVPSYPRAFLEDKMLIKEGLTPFFQMGERLPIICLHEKSLLAEGYQPLRSRPVRHLPDWLKKPTFNDFILREAGDFWVGVHSIRGRHLFVAGLDPVEPFVSWAFGTYTTMCLDVDEAIEHLEPKYHLKTISIWERLRKGGLDIGVLAPMKNSPVLVTLERVGYDGHVYVIVPDNAAGKTNVFTVYELPGSPSRPVRIIGRELPLGVAEEVIRKNTVKRKTTARRSVAVKTKQPGV